MKLECGCLMVSVPAGPEIRMCKLHSGAELMRDALVELLETLEARAQAHHCMGYHCSTCYPAGLSDVARKALESAGIKA